MTSDSLVERLALEARGAQAFEAHPGPAREAGPGRVFGGLLLAQSAEAARLGGSAAPVGPLQAMHARFLAPARYGEALRLTVAPLRDGVSMDVRSVRLEQAGVSVLSATASFAEPFEEVGFDAPGPDWPGPEGRAAVPAEHGELARSLELRPVSEVGPATVAWWMRPRAPLPEDPGLHAAVLAYATDGPPVAAAAAALGLGLSRLRAASLDHAFWLHAEPRLEDWHLVTARCTVVRAGHGHSEGAVYRRDGGRVASFAQGARIYAPAGA